MQVGKAHPYIFISLPTALPSLSPGVIAGIAVGTIVGLVLIVALVFIVYFCRVLVAGMFYSGFCKLM